MDPPHHGEPKRTSSLPASLHSHLVSGPQRTHTTVSPESLAGREEEGEQEGRLDPPYALHPPPPFRAQPFASGHLTPAAFEESSGSASSRAHSSSPDSEGAQAQGPPRARLAAGTTLPPLPARIPTSRARTDPALYASRNLYSPYTFPPPAPPPPYAWREGEPGPSTLGYRPGAQRFFGERIQAVRESSISSPSGGSQASSGYSAGPGTSSGYREPHTAPARYRHVPSGGADYAQVDWRVLAEAGTEWAGPSSGYYDPLRGFVRYDSRPVARLPTRVSSRYIRHPPTLIPSDTEGSDQHDVRTPSRRSFASARSSQEGSPGGVVRRARQRRRSFDPLLQESSRSREYSSQQSDTADDATSVGSRGRPSQYSTRRHRRGSFLTLREEFPEPLENIGQLSASLPAQAGRWRHLPPPLPPFPYEAAGGTIPTDEPFGGPPSETLHYPVRTPYTSNPSPLENFGRTGIGAGHDLPPPSFSEATFPHPSQDIPGDDVYDLAEYVSYEKEVDVEPPVVKGRGKRAVGTASVDDQDDRRKKIPRKTEVACFFCRGRKLRCDGRRPSCRNCYRRSQPCAYADQPRRRGPGKAPKRGATKTQPADRNTDGQAATKEPKKKGEPATTRPEERAGDPPPSPHTPAAPTPAPAPPAAPPAAPIAPPSYSFVPPEGVEASLAEHRAAVAAQTPDPRALMGPFTRFLVHPLGIDMSADVRELEEDARRNAGTDTDEPKTPSGRREQL